MTTTASCCNDNSTAAYHENECWWAALGATARDGDDAEHPDHAHQERAAAYQRAHCASSCSGCTRI